jgi:hypothetical protein
MVSHNIEIALIPKEYMGEEKDVIRVMMRIKDDFTIGYGFTLLEAINNFDKELLKRQ